MANINLTEKKGIIQITKYIMWKTNIWPGEEGTESQRTHTFQTNTDVFPIVRIQLPQENIQLNSVPGAKDLLLS